MKEYRITKYDPQYRNNGIYHIEDWTSISDIGKSFGDCILTSEQYFMVENAYVQCCLDLFDMAQEKTLKLVDFEIYSLELQLEHKNLDRSAIEKIIPLILREKCWAKLESATFFVHFGYDYYMYIGTSLPFAAVVETATRHGLFCEEFLSPYR